MRGPSKDPPTPTAPGWGWGRLGWGVTQLGGGNVTGAEGRSRAWQAKAGPSPLSFVHSPSHSFIHHYGDTTSDKGSQGISAGQGLSIGDNLSFHS